MGIYKSLRKRKPVKRDVIFWFYLESEKQKTLRPKIKQYSTSGEEKQRENNVKIKSG